MTKRNSYLTATDLFCGSGGISIGAKRAGVVLKIAANHWRRAIESHQANFPEVDHDCADISQVRVERYPSTDILLASPECTTHSLASGVARSSRQTSIFGCEPCEKVGEAKCPVHSDAVLRSRATMWDVPRFAERHRYRIIIVENVVDVARWEPFLSWLGVMDSLGYRHRVVSFNSMFALPTSSASVPTPQSRDRVYIVFWRKGNRTPDLDFFQRGFCQRCAVNVDAIQTWKNGRTIGRYGDATKRGQYFYSCPSCRAEVRPYYYAALNAIDWSIKATRIGDRKRPLKDRTMGRLRYGVNKYGRHPLLITTNMTSDGGRSRPVTAPGFTQTGSSLTALVSPHVLLHMQGSFRTGTLADPLSTQVASCAQDFIASETPFLVETAYSHAPDSRAMSPVSPLATQSTRLTTAVCLPSTPFLSSAGSRETAPISTAAPVPTLTGSDRFGVTFPAGFVATLRGTSPDQIAASAHGLHDALHAITAGGVHAGLVSQAAIINLRDYRVVNQLVTGVDGFLPAQVCTPQTAVVSRSPFVVSYYSGGGQTSGIDAPIDAITTVDRHALVDPPTEDPIDINDWYFRMLVPHEIQAGMGFPADYIVTGNAREKVKQLGNAVTPEVPNILLARCIESLHPEVAA